LQVLGREQVHRGKLDAGFLAPPQHLGDLVGANAIAVTDVVVTLVTSPPPVAVAQDGDVARQVGARPRQLLAQAHLVDPVGRFLETRGNEIHEDQDYCGNRIRPCQSVKVT
jgi:hypothetical protein